jgi:hypothetical protein
VIEIESNSDPYSMFLFVIRSPKTREKCTGKVRMFFDFVGILPGEMMVEQSKTFCEKARSGSGSTFSIIVQYLEIKEEYG